MSIKSNLVLKFLKIKILSSIPGRLRLNIPNYKALLNQSSLEDKNVIELLKLIHGVHTVEFNPHTENFLILYNQEVSNEKDIIKIIKETIASIVSYMDEMKRDSIEADQLTRMVKEMLKRNN